MELNKLLNGIPCHICGDPNREISDISYDTRTQLDKSHLFVCIKGFSFDGHSYSSEAYSRGVRVFAASDKLDLPEDATVIYTEDTRKFLALASANRFGHPAEKLLTIGITGTKGKTSTSFMLQSILNEAGIPTGVIGSTGVFYQGKFEETGNTTPESYLLQSLFAKMVDAGCKAVVFEAASQGFKLHRTYGIPIDAAVFTNISPDHIGPNEHADFEEYLNCKKKIFAQSKIAFVNADDPHFDEIVSGAECPVVPFGGKGNKDGWQAEEMKFSLQDHRLHTTFRAIRKEECIAVESGVPGLFSVSNALAAISVAKQFGVSDEAIQKGLLKVRVRGRMEIVPTETPFTVIIDAAHEGFSCKSLFETIGLYAPKHIISVFGCGGNRSKLRRYGMGEVIGAHSDFSIITSDNSRMEKTEDIIADILVGMEKSGGKYEIVIDRRDAIKKALRTATEGDVILLIGKGHETYEDKDGKKTPFDEKQIVLDFIAAGMPQDN